jgi:hypothetical protein
MKIDQNTHIPRPLSLPYLNVNFWHLRLLTQQYLILAADPSTHENRLDDMRSDIFEETMCAFYGVDIFNWINSQQD